MGKNKTLSPTPPRYKIRCQLNPTLPLHQRLTPLLPGAWVCRPDLILKDHVRWGQPPGENHVVWDLRELAHLTLNPGYAAFPPDSVKLRSTLPVGALVLGRGMAFQHRPHEAAGAAGVGNLPEIQNRVILL